MTIALLAAASSVHTVRWANAFLARGHTVHLVSLHAAASGLLPGVRLHSLPFRKGLGYVVNGPRLDELLRKLKPNVLNAHYASGYGTLARGCDHAPLVLNVWGSDVFEFPDRSALHRWWLLRNLRAARVVVSTSEAMARRVKDLLPGVDVREVPFGVDSNRFRPSPERGAGAVTIGTVKTLAPAYGIDRLIRAFALLVRMEGVPDPRLRIVGDGPQRAELRRLAEALGVADRTDFVGAVPHAEVPGVLRGLDVYVALSRAESFGVAVLEASACALPVVVSDAGGLPEVVRDGLTGFVVPAGGPKVAAQRLRQLVRDPALRWRMGQDGRRWVRERYEWSHCVDRMIEVLQNAKE